MKILKLFVSVLIVAFMSAILPAQVAGAAATELFFSEYIEGSSFNKALEIYNGTGSSVDLNAGNYVIEFYFNGNTSPGTTINLTGSVADGDVYVVADDGADAAILSVTDQISASGFFNGDDAVVLRKNGVVIDSIGELGTDPGTEWSGGGIGTQNETLRRMADVCAGDTNESDSFDPSVEWDGFAQDTIDGLGVHTANCNGGPADLVINEIMQNPSAVSDSAGEWFELYNVGNTDVDVNGWTIADNGIDSHVINNGGPLLVPAGGYLVLGNNSDTGTNGGVNVGYTYGGSWFLSNSADEVVLFDDSLNEIDRVEYDNGLTFPDPSGASMALSDSALDNNDGANWCTSSTPFGAGDLGTPGAANDCIPLVQIVKIHEVQGSGPASPLDGTTVLIEGIVVGDFQDGSSGTNGDLNGFFVQEEDADADADPLTSEGIFVVDGNLPAVNVAIGDLVRVEGLVSESFDLTEITSPSDVTVLSIGNPLPTAATLSLPVTSVDDFEASEGMLVTFPQALVIAEYFNFDRFGEILLTTDRQVQPTAIYEPGSTDAANLMLANSLSRITLDDGRTTQNPDPAIHPDGNIFDLSNLFRGGDTVQNVTGVMDFTFGVYRIHPTEGADYTSVNPRKAQPDDVGGNLKVASFNVLNYFTTLDNSGPVCGPAGDQLCLGADNAEEFTRQRDKIIEALTAIDADVVGLVSMENHPGDVPTADLVSGLNDAAGAGTYDYIATGAIGTEAVRVALIYKPASVSPRGAYAVLDSSVDPRFMDDFNRPALAQTFQDDTTDGVFTVAVNHFKSKGSPCDVDDPDTGDGAGNCNLTRKAAAEALVDWLATDPTDSGDEDFLIIGDLNSYDKEDPIDVIVAGGFTDLISYFLGEDAYSFVLFGQTGYLDYALANAGLMDEITGATVWHINADEPDLINYDTSFKQDAQDDIYAPDAYRSSSHDPVIIGLDVSDETASTCDIDADGDINRTDVRSILINRNQPASGPDDPADADGDGLITVRDAKICISQCTNPRCAPSNPVIGISEVALDGTLPNIRSQETNEGNLLADSLLWQATQLAGAFGQPMPDIALQNGGGIRNNSLIPAGNITLQDTFAIAPFPNFVVIVPNIPRDQFKEILENAVACTQSADFSTNPFCGSGRFAQVAGFSFDWTASGTAMVIDADDNVVTPGTRVINVVLDDGTPIVLGGSVVPGPALNIATIDFLANGGDQYPYRGAPFTGLGVTYQESLSNYIQDGLGGLISASDYPEGGEGRIINAP